MILLDVNVLVLAHRPELEHHEQALGWLIQALQSEEPVVVWDVILTSAYRVLTHPKFVREVGANFRAWQFIEEVRSASVVLAPGTRYWGILSRLLHESRAVGNLVTDASIAALAIERGCRLATFDGDFARFKGLYWFVPEVLPTE